MHPTRPRSVVPLVWASTVILYAMVIALTILPTRADAQETSGRTTFGDILFGVNRPKLEAQVRQQQAQNAWIQAQTAEAEANIALTRQQTRLHSLVQHRREWLAEVWVDNGCSQADAVARASAWTPSLSDVAVIQQLRKEGSKAAIPAIKSATASFNYQLADQLMLAFGLVHTEEQEAAKSSAAKSPENSTDAQSPPSCVVADHCLSTPSTSSISNSQSH